MGVGSGVYGGTQTKLEARTGRKLTSRQLQANATQQAPWSGGGPSPANTHCPHPLHITHNAQHLHRGASCGVSSTHTLAAAGTSTRVVYYQCDRKQETQHERTSFNGYHRAPRRSSWNSTSGSDSDDGGGRLTQQGFQSTGANERGTESCVRHRHRVVLRCTRESFNDRKEKYVKCFALK